MKIVAIVQARRESSRFPNKILGEINDVPMLEFLLKRLSNSKFLDEIVVSMPNTKTNLELESWLTRLGFSSFFGSSDDVLARYYETAIKYEADVIVRITGDCPFVDPNLVDQIIANFINGSDCVISTNTQPPTFPDGLDCSVFSMRVLAEAHKKAIKPEDREHVTSFIYREFPDKINNLLCHGDFSAVRLTVDERIDYEVVKEVANEFRSNPNFTFKDLINLYVSKPQLFVQNGRLIRNEGTNMNSGQKLYRRAFDVISGGTMLYSKKPENFLPNLWPTYFSKAKGCEIWDLDNNKYFDFSMMGIGTNTLGYAHEEIDDAVIEAIKSGNMSTLNASEEVELAERLIEIHPWAQQVKFARTGGEVATVAIRIARSFSKKDKVAFCGYHGWHDWYLSANIANSKNLSSHLLDGLGSSGVPAVLSGSALPFFFNDIDSFESAISTPGVGTVIMEVMRNTEPNLGFLDHVRKRTRELDIVLIFDECTSGFRETFGGLHKKYAVEPDLAILGKALGNGFAITAVIGTKEVMQKGMDSFISSTFWSERIGSVAALKTLEVMQRTNSWEVITRTGQVIELGWKNLSLEYGVGIETFGISSMIKFRLTEGDTQIFKTYMVQEMLKKGFLAGTQFNASLSHSPDLITEYFASLRTIFAGYSSCIHSGQNPMLLLDGPVANSDFKRLN